MIVAYVYVYSWNNLVFHGLGGTDRVTVVFTTLVCIRF